MKFISLLKKELRELLNKQFLIGMVLTAALLMSIGSLMSSVAEEAVSDNGTLNLCDQDQTEFTAEIISQLEQAGYTIKMQVVDNDDRSALMQKLEISSLLIIPAGFTDSILEDNAPADLECVNVMKSTSAMSTLSDSTSGAISIINTLTAQSLMAQTGMNADQIALTQAPIATKDVTVVNDKAANINSSTLISFLSLQGMIIPLIVFILVMYTSQMILNAVSSEKLDKTLETLLSAPVSRLSIIGAKMLAAAIVALLNAVVYMFGFSSYITGALDGSVGDASLSSVIGEALTFDQVMDQLGLSLSVSSYLLIGLQMFFTIMIALSVSMILGAMVTDIKSAQTLLMPIMICAMIPYMISMISDINTMPTLIRMLVYAIPFSHTFSAMNNLMFGNMTAYWLGLGYQIIFFVICMALALRLFTSDKIFTMSIKFNRKKH